MQLLIILRMEATTKDKSFIIDIAAVKHKSIIILGLQRSGGANEQEQLSGRSGVVQEHRSGSDGEEQQSGRSGAVKKQRSCGDDEEQLPGYDVHEQPFGDGWW